MSNEHLITLSLKHSNKHDAVVTIEISNDTDQNFWISRDALMLDGFKNDKFDIFHTCNAHEVPYIGRHVKYHPEQIQLETHGSLSTTLDLAEAYDFTNTGGGDYSVSFKTTLFLCPDRESYDCDIVKKSTSVSFYLDYEL